MSIVRMDQKFVNSSLQVPPGKRRIELVDEATPGLYIEVRDTSPGQGTYWFRAKVDRRLRHFRLGSTADLSFGRGPQGRRANEGGSRLGQGHSCR